MQTATEVGGDYFGYVETGGRLCVVVGDATGHGMASGLVAGMLKAVMVSLSHRTQRSSGPAVWLTRLNTALRNSIAQRGLGVCVGICLVDVDTGEVEMGMAGIPHPFHISPTGVVERVPLSGTPLGYLKKIVPATTTRTLAPGERLVLMSDGLIEQVNGAGEEWGYHGVEAALAVVCSTHATPEAIAEGLLAACEVFGSGQPRTDDRTVVVLARIPS
jgi:sigma-B regulation protein RsbU (phosphoserine phosphatase)